MNIVFYDRKLQKLIKENGYKSSSLDFLYNTILGRILLKLFVSRKVASNIYSIYIKSKFSKKKIDKFIKEYNINMNQFEQIQYRTFNDFFIRKYTKELFEISSNINEFVSCASCKIKRYKIDKNTKLCIKNSIYTIQELLDSNKEYSEYIGGECLIFRLTVDDYHRHCYFDNGSQEKHKIINGKLHTVSAISQTRYKVFSQNSREWTTLHTENYGDVIQIEVGALLVGKIKNHNNETCDFVRGEEKGYFEFGGSTIIQLFKPNVIKVDEDIIENSNKDIETKVVYGEKIGEKIC